MEPRSYPFYQGLIRIANRSSGDPLRAMQAVLRWTRRKLGLSGCRLLLLDARGRTFDLALAASGPPRYAPLTLRFAGSNAGLCLTRGRSLARGSLLYLPVANPERNFGVLRLEGEIADETRRSFGEAAAAQLAILLAGRAGGGAGPADYARLEALSAENDRKFREISLLYRLSRALHSTLRLNDLMHLILSAATLPEGGGFERAMLFMVNERSGVLQGMLGVTRETAALILPARRGVRNLEQPEVNPASREAQRQTPFCRQVMSLRIPLDAADNPLARAVRTGRVLMAERADDFAASLAVRPPLGACAFAPLSGRDRPLALLVVDNPSGAGVVTPGRRRFLQLFASQAGAAMENSILMNRLETAHQDLQETQERLIHGEKMAVLGEMAASVAHELKNPLVAIGGFARRLVKRDSSREDDGEYARIIAREAQRMEKILGDILAFSRKNILCFAECDLVAVLTHALEVEGEALKSTGIGVRVEVAEDLPPIMGDAQKLRQVIGNLVANARQAMEEKAGGVLTVRAYPCLLRGDQAVALEVEDTGGGMPPEVLRNIFNPFFTTKEHGTGLGLPISHRIVAHHGGEFEIENREQGAAFIIRLPGRTTGKAFD